MVSMHVFRTNAELVRFLGNFFAAFEPASGEYHMCSFRSKKAHSCRANP